MLTGEDYTFCDSDCKNMKCDRNQKHIRVFWKPHSFAQLKGTIYCENERQKEVEKKQRKKH